MSDDLYYEDPKDKRRREFQSARSSSQVIDLVWWPFRFFFMNFPAIIPAWIATYYFCYILRAIGLNGGWYAGGIVLSFLLFVAASWRFLRWLHTTGEQTPEGLMKNFLVGTVLAYIFLGYAVPVGFILFELNPGHPIINTLVALGGACGGVYFYQEKLRRTPEAMLANEHFARTKEEYSKEKEEEYVRHG